MCTVTFLPINERSYILTSNRDESLDRKVATPPTINNVSDAKIIYPIDGEAKGTWIAAGMNGRAVCLMNGAFLKHNPSPPYRKSRGLVLLDSFSFRDPNSFANGYDLSGIEPFTIIWVEVVNKILIHELRWDGSSMAVKEISADHPLIWSSVSLYEEATIDKRKQWFAKWLQENKNYSVKKIRQFHHFGGEGDGASNIKMKLGSSLATVSITSVNVDDEKIHMNYEDTISGNSMNLSLILNKEIK